MIKNLVNSTLKFSLVLGIFVLLLVANFKIWRKDYNQEQQIQQLQQELHLQHQENQKIQQINDELKQKIDHLKVGSHEMIEEEARKDFGMVKEDETYYLFDDKDKKNLKK